MAKKKPAKQAAKKTEPKAKEAKEAKAVKAGKTLCRMLKKGVLKSNPEEYKAQVRDGKYLCRKCGRVAVVKKKLCKGDAL